MSLMKSLHEFGFLLTGHRVMTSIQAIILSVLELLLPSSVKATTMIEDFDNVAFGQIVTMSVLAEILFRGQYISGAGVVVVDKLSDDEIVESRVKWMNEYFPDSALLLLGEPTAKTSDVGLDLWRDVNLLCQSLHSDDVGGLLRTQDEWIRDSGSCIPRALCVHRLTVPPSYCRDVVVAGNVIQTVQAGLRESVIFDEKKLEKMFASADSIKSFMLAVQVTFLLAVQVTFLLIMFLLVMFSFLLTEIESTDYVSAGHVLVPADRDRIC
ncbi:hypothetical protein Tco_0643886 [Tanacetum coccineum]